MQPVCLGFHDPSQLLAQAWLVSQASVTVWWADVPSDGQHRNRFWIWGRTCHHHQEPTAPDTDTATERHRSQGQAVAAFHLAGTAAFDPQPGACVEGDTCHTRYDEIRRRPGAAGGTLRDRPKLSGFRRSRKAGRAGSKTGTQLLGCSHCPSRWLSSRIQGCLQSHRLAIPVVTAGVSVAEGLGEKQVQEGSAPLGDAWHRHRQRKSMPASVSVPELPRKGAAWHKH